MTNVEKFDFIFSARNSIDKTKCPCSHGESYITLRFHEYKLSVTFSRHNDIRVVVVDCGIFFPTVYIVDGEAFVDTTEVFSMDNALTSMLEDIYQKVVKSMKQSEDC